MTIAVQLAFFSPKYSRLGQSNNYYTLKGTYRVVIRQYFVNYVTLRIWYTSFSIVRCPQKPFNSLFDGSSTNYSPKICCFKKLANTGTWLLGFNEVNSVKLYGI